MTQDNGRLFPGCRRLAKLTIGVVMLLAGPAIMAQGPLGNTASPLPASAAPGSEALMENPRNPLVVMQTSLGDIQLELFPDAAPQNVEFFLDLTSGQLPASTPDTDTPTVQPYYDGLTFHRVLRDTLIQAGDPARAGRQRAAQNVIDEINARGLGLEQQRLLDANGKPHPWLNIGNQEDFRHRVLVPLYQDMGITNEQILQTRQERVLQRLQSMNLLQFHEMLGYRYDGSLPSRRPARGSVVMVNRGPGTNDGEFFIALTDMPWLIGTSTVIGRVVTGMQTAERISQNPAASTRIYQVTQINGSINTGE